MKTFKKLYFALGFVLAFILWTVLVCVVDVKGVGANQTNIGLASINTLINELIGSHLVLYFITDWLSVLPICIAFGFGVLGLCQWVKRKSLFKVDKSLFVLGGFYLVVFAVYFLFENITINYRPILIGGNLESSYPSSTTMLVACIMPTSLMQFKGRIKNRLISIAVSCAIILFTVLMVIGRIISGVHWFSDIVGGIFISVGLVLFYDFTVNFFEVANRS